MFIPKENINYTSNSSDLLLRVHKIYYINEEKDYIKLKGSLYHKLYKFLYETKNYKLKLSNIQHWKGHEN